MRGPLALDLGRSIAHSFLCVLIAICLMDTTHIFGMDIDRPKAKRRTMANGYSSFKCSFGGNGFHHITCAISKKRFSSLFLFFWESVLIRNAHLSSSMTIGSNKQRNHPFVGNGRRGALAHT